jgi:HAD superfamily hydrolase (TIGR01490 family)
VELALFDFDGTLTESETWTPFVRRITGAKPSLARRLAVAPTILAHRAGLISSSRGRQWAVRALFRGLETATVLAAGEAYAAETLPSVLRAETVARLIWHRDRGDRVVVVSASLDAYLHPWCARLGVDCICTELETQGKRLTGRYLGGDCSGPEKAKRVTARYRLADYSQVHAYGDTSEDRELLALAHVKTYRGQVIDSWDEVRQFDHPSEAQTTRAPSDATAQGGAGSEKR